MQTYVVGPQGGIEALTIEDRPAPTPGPGQALVRMKAYSLNYRDYGNVMSPPRDGFVPLSDGAGEVVAVGAGVTRVKPGDRVACNFFEGLREGRLSPQTSATALGGAIDGVFREEVVFDAEGLVIVPDYLTWEEAATLPCAGLTAWNALRDLVPGETVLVLGTGGVSVFAVQFAKAKGARVIATSSSDAKLERVKGLGADVGINYKTTPGWGQAVWEATGGKGADHVIEVGGFGTMGESVQAVAYGGHIALVGLLDGWDKPFDQIGPMLHKTIKVQGEYVGSRADFEAMNAFLGKTELRPVIGETHAFADAQAAFRSMAAGSHFGKIVVKGS